MIKFFRKIRQNLLSEGKTGKYFKYAIGIISPEGRPPLIKLAVQKNQAQYLITQPWHESQNIHSEDEERVIFSFRVHPGTVGFAGADVFGVNIKGI